MTGNNNKGLIVQERDKHLLRELGVMRVIDRDQAKCVAGFQSTTRANTRLLALTKSDLLRRYFIGTDAVGRKALYTLSSKGAKLVESTYQGLRRGRDEVLVGDFFAAHQLKINEIYCTLKYRSIPILGTTFVRWLSFAEPVEAGSRLIPDGFVETQTANGSLAAFLEVDLGNETRSVFRTKVESYLRYAVSGHFSEKLGQTQFRVLVVTNSEQRMKSLRFVTSTVTDKIFWFTTFDAIRSEGFWSAIWQRPKENRPQALISHP